MGIKDRDVRDALQTLETEIENYETVIKDLESNVEELETEVSDLKGQAEYIQLMRQPCYYCGDNLGITGLGLDRIDNSIGYVVSNVLPCCKHCNRTRGDRYTVEETKAMIDFIKEYRNGKTLLCSGHSRETGSSDETLDGPEDES